MSPRSDIGSGSTTINRYGMDNPYQTSPTTQPDTASRDLHGKTPSVLRALSENDSSQDKIPDHLIPHNGVTIRKSRGCAGDLPLDPSLRNQRNRAGALYPTQNLGLEIESKGHVDAGLYLRESGTSRLSSPASIEVQATSIRMVIAHTAENTHLNLTITSPKQEGYPPWEVVQSKRSQSRLRLYLCPKLRIYLNILWSGSCNIWLPPNFTGKLDIYAYQQDSVEVLGSIRSRMRVIEYREDSGHRPDYGSTLLKWDAPSVSQSFWIGEGAEEDREFDRCSLTAYQSRGYGSETPIMNGVQITVRFWEGDPGDLVYADTADVLGQEGAIEPPTPCCIFC